MQESMWWQCAAITQSLQVEPFMISKYVTEEKKKKRAHSQVWYKMLFIAQMRLVLPEICQWDIRAGCIS